MAHDASNNNPIKESVTALVGIVLLLVMIVAIGISAFLRPAGEHQPATPTEQEQTVESSTAEAQPTQASDTAVAEAQDKLEQTAEDAQAPTQATATEDKPAAQTAPADTTNTAPMPKVAEDKQATQEEATETDKQK
ncbi:hypothetical protein LU276_08600 [Moraxella haemolytica]|uniref:hypothetical protein n=1 Tax=Moraxella haemolytica TaxID=2904119 RepID=UPI002542B6FB|nr:hypothetical protein [Moraxella sp. ZY171148]WII95053.1 hypothetical protein LU276_08600 [Moraxella sp. ZY171148]